MTDELTSPGERNEQRGYRWSTWAVAARDGDTYADLDPGEGTPFLLAPDGTFDLELNQFFTTGRMLVSSPHTRIGYARDIVAFLSFAALRQRERSSDVWRTVNRDDRRAYARWRNDAADGPRVAPKTWNRESVAAYRLYHWALSMGHVRESPISYETDIRVRNPRQRGGRAHDVRVSERRPETGSGGLRWLDGSDFRKWRDVGVRGLTASGERPCVEVRSMSGRDVAYVNLMVRTGLRLEEQSSLLLSDIPKRNGLPYVAHDLPAVIAKNSSGRRVYFPDQILAQVEAYVRSDRAWAVANGRENDLYEPAGGRWHIRKDMPGWAYSGQRRVRLSKLRPNDRRDLLIETDRGFVPAALWLTREGRPMTTKGWQGVFERASSRAARLGVPIRATPHTLRHSFAVATLEQLQRGHNQRLAEQSADQRRHYQMVFGDPLNFVRLLLGHRSVETTSIYLHALAEIELETRLMLMGDDWGLPAEVRDVEGSESQVGTTS